MKAHKSHVITHAMFLYYSKSSCEYMRQDTLFIGVGALVGRWGRVKWTKGEGLSRVLTMVKTAPLGTSSRRWVKNLNSMCLILKKWAWYKPISLSTLPFMLCEPTIPYAVIWNPKVSPIYLQTCFCLLKRPEESIWCFCLCSVLLFVRFV